MGARGPSSEVEGLLRRVSATMMMMITTVVRHAV